jgi:hypothetical protein
MNAVQNAETPRQYTEDDYLDGIGPNPEEDEQRRLELLHAQVDALGETLAQSRSDAIEARQASGIEQQWIEDEEYYEGIDDANRKENPSWRSKPMGGGGVDVSERGVQPTGSTVFPNITRPYVDAGVARVIDILSPTDDSNWTLDPTPVPEMIPIAEGKLPEGIRRSIAQKFPTLEQQQAEEARLVQVVKGQVDAATEMAEKAERLIRDWHTESHFAVQFRDAMQNCGKVGTGILKGPFPVKRKQVAYKDGQLLVNEEIKPASVNVDYWNFYPDGACGEDIHNGSFTWERDDITTKKLTELKGVPGYIDSQIDLVLQEGPMQACAMTDQNRDGVIKRDTKGLYEIWYFHGTMSKDQYQMAMELKNPILNEDGSPAESLENMQDSIYVQLTMINRRVIRVIQNPLDTGDFPYDLLVWQKRKNSPFGMGIARQIRTAQRILTGAFRNMMDNAGQAAGPQVVVNPEFVVPQNGIYEFEPWKIWQMVKDLEGDAKIDQVFRFVTVDMQQPQLQAIIELALRLAEDTTGFPMIMQGQTNSATPDTLGGMQLQNQNASTVLRRLARMFDAATESHITRYHNYLLQYGPDDVKGEFVVNASGSVGLVEREIQGQQLQQMMTLAVNPVYGIDPQKLGKGILRSMRLPVEDYEFTDEDWKKVVEQLAAQAAAAQNPAVEVATIRAQSAERVAAANAASRENVEAFKAEQANQRAQDEQAFQLLLNDLEQDVTAFCEGNENQRSAEALKTKLADTMIKVKAQLAANNQKQIASPAMEPKGRAPNGEAFQK